MAIDIDSPRLTAEDCGRAADKLNAAKSLVEEVAETLNSVEGGASGAEVACADALSNIDDAVFILGRAAKGGAQ